MANVHLTVLVPSAILQTAALAKGKAQNCIRRPGIRRKQVAGGVITMFVTILLDPYVISIIVFFFT